MINRESVGCPVCFAKTNQACDFNGRPAPIIKDGDTERRAVHAGRYAETLHEDEKSEFWGDRLHDYLTGELKLMGEAEGK